jgi:hypothetical protein
VVTKKLLWSLLQPTKLALSLSPGVRSRLLPPCSITWMWWSSLPPPSTANRKRSSCGKKLTATFASVVDRVSACGSPPATGTL